MRQLRSLLDKPLFKGSLGVTTQAIELATEIPVPTCEQLELLLKKSYLPPINDEFAFGSDIMSPGHQKDILAEPEDATGS